MDFKEKKETKNENIFFIFINTLIYSLDKCLNVQTKQGRYKWGYFLFLTV